MVIADSSIWIEYFRVRESPVQEVMQNLLGQDEILVVGVALSEVLRGVKSVEEHNRVALAMRALPYAEAARETWVRCADIMRTLRSEGVTVHLADALIAAIAIEGGHEVYTRDGDFERIPGVRLYRTGGIAS